MRIMRIIMKYLEEIGGGRCFFYDNIYYITTNDFNKNNQRLCIYLRSGGPRWLDMNLLVSHINLYTLNQENEIVPL